MTKEKIKGRYDQSSTGRDEETLLGGSKVRPTHDSRAGVSMPAARRNNQETACLRFPGIRTGDCVQLLCFRGSGPAGEALPVEER